MHGGSRDATAGSPPAPADISMQLTYALAAPMRFPANVSDFGIVLVHASGVRSVCARRR